MEHPKDNHEVDPAEIPADKGETRSINGEVQPNSGETHAVNAELHPIPGDIEQIDAEVKPLQGEFPTVDTEICPNSVEPEPIHSEFYPGHGEPQPLNIQMPPGSGEPQPFFDEMQQNFVISHPLPEEIKQSDGNTQLMDVEIQSNFEEMHPHRVEFQSFSADMKPSNGELRQSIAVIQPHNVEIEPYRAEAQLNNGDIQPYCGEIQPFDTVTQPGNAELQLNNRKRKRSMVWEHFTIENVSPECRRASCNQCKQSFAYSTGSKVAGTSHLKRHIIKGTCAALLKSQEKNQQIPRTPAIAQSGRGSGAQKRRYRTYNSSYVAFDQNSCRQEIAKMITRHDYPLDMVEHPGFVSFVKSLQPNCDLGNFNTVEGDCIANFHIEKQNLMRTIEAIPGRICLSLDLWTSNQTVGYFVLTGHFIDSNWKPCKRVLNVVLEPYPDSGTALSHAISVCLSEWKLESKLLSITISQPSSEAVLERLKDYLSVKNPLLNGQLLIRNCIARTLSSMAQDVLGLGQEVVDKVRDSVKHVKASDSHEEKFLHLKQQLQVPSEKSLSLDDQTKWNTTYEMLVAASELREVFSCLDASDPDYKTTPVIEVWKQVETLCTYLKLLYDAANILAKTPNPTIMTCFHEVWKIYSDLGRAVLSEDPFVANLVKPMHEKINEYWKECSLILAVAVVLDPRFKMKLVEFTFSKFYGEEAPAHVSIVDEGIREFFKEYAAHPMPLIAPPAGEETTGSNVHTDENGEVHLTDHGLSDFDVFIMETTEQQMKSELDQYLEETLLPRVQEIDVLNWWKLNNSKYPVLSTMARDILTIPVCSVPPDSIFDTAPKVMDQYRSSIRAGIAEALICLKDWLQCGQS